MIRQATTADLPRMAGLAKEFYASSTCLREFRIERFVETWTALLGNESGVIFLLIDGEKIAGTISGVLYPDPYSRDLIATEFFWFVHEDTRGHGVRLYRAFEDWARKKHADEIRMVHLSDSMPNKVADFYKRVGYSQIETLYSKRLDIAEMRRAG